jgi:hypothetical protein
LPWADVDQIVGACRACGAPFDFTVRSAAQLVVGPAPPDLSKAELPTIELPLLASVSQVPAGILVKVTKPLAASGGPYRGNLRPQTDIELSWRTPGGQLLYVVAFVWDAITVGQFVIAHFARVTFPVVPALSALFAVAITLMALRTLRFRTRLVATEAAISVEQRTNTGMRTQTLQIEEVSRFYCEQTSKITGSISLNDGPTVPTRTIVHHVCAQTHDGRRVPLGIDIEREAIALYVATLLQERLATRPN